jgi:hypothetical protein
MPSTHDKATSTTPSNAAAAAAAVALDSLQLLPEQVQA